MSLPKIGVVLALEGEKEYKQAISDIGKVQKTLASEMEKLSIEYENNAKSGEFLNKKMEILNKQYEANKVKVETAQSALGKATERYNEATKKVDEYKEKLKQAEKTLEEMRKSSTASAADIKKQEKAVSDLGKSLQQTQNAVRAADNQMEDWQKNINDAETGLLKASKATESATKEFEKLQKTEALEKLTASADGADKALGILSSEMNKLSAQYSGNEKSAEALAAKQDVLAAMAEQCKTKITSLKEALAYAEQEFGENSKEAQQLKVALNNAAAESYKTEKAIKATAEASKKLSDTNLNKFSGQMKKIGDGAEKMGEKMEKVGSAMTSHVTAPIVAGMALAVKGTEEFRSDLSKLETNAQMAGQNVDVANEALKGLYAITGETDSNVEALSNLLATGFTGSGLTEAVDALSGAVIKFPDTLKIESLADGLQETLATGEATGQFGELLERVGINLDDFNAGLESATKNGKAQEYALNTLARSGLSRVNDEYRKNNKALIDSKNAMFDMQQQLASLGDKLQPVMTQLIDFASGVLDKFNGLDEETQGLIIRMGLLAATAGPVINAGGQIVSGGANIIKTVSGLSGTLAEVIGKGGAVGGILKTLAALLSGPAGIAVAAVGAAAGIMGLVVHYQNAHDQVLILNDSIDEQKNKWDELSASTEENVSSNAAEIESTRSLWERLRELTDANGNVIGDKQELKGIIDEINSIMPDTVKWIDDERIAYNDVSASIETLMEKKKAKAILDALEPQYQQAMLNFQGDMTKRAEAYNLVVDEQRKLQELKSRSFFLTQVQEIASQEEKVMKSKEAYNEINNVVNEEQQLFKKYEDGTKALTSSNIKEIKKFNSEYTSSVNQSSTASISSIDEMYKQIQNNNTAYKLLLEDTQKQSSKTSIEMRKQIRNDNDELIKQFEQMAGMSVEAYGQGLNKELPKAEYSIQHCADSLIRKAKESGLGAAFDGLWDMHAELPRKNLSAVKNLLEGDMDSFKKTFIERLSAIGIESGDAASKSMEAGGEQVKAAHKTFTDDIEAQTYEAGNRLGETTATWGQSMAGGIAAGNVEAAEASRTLAEYQLAEIRAAFEAGVPGITEEMVQQAETRAQVAAEQASEVGMAYTNNLASGMSENAPAVEAAQQGLNDTVAAASTQIGATGAEAGKTYPEGVASGIQENAPIITDALGETNATIQEKAAEGGKTYPEGVAEGMEATRDAVPEKARDIIDEANQAATDESAVAQGSGASFMDNMAQGAEDSGGGFLSAVGGWIAKAAQSVRNWWDSLSGGDGGATRGFASGTRSAPKGVAMVGEKAPEIIADQSGKAHIAAGPSLYDFKGGERVYNAQETQAILNNTRAAIPVELYNSYIKAMAPRVASGNAAIRNLEKRYASAYPVPAQRGGIARSTARQRR